MANDPDAQRKALDQLRVIVRGIDADECDDEEGWWETSTGAKFGAQKLAELEALVCSLINHPAPAAEPCETCGAATREANRYCSDGFHAPAAEPAEDRVEAVAKAIFSATSEWTQSHDNWDGLPDYGKDVFRDRARAALSADPLRAEVVEALRECAADLEAEIRDRYANMYDPDTDRRRNRDMVTVERAMATLAKLEAS